MLEVIILDEYQNLTLTQFNALLDYVSVEKKEKIKSFHRIIDAQNSLLGDIIIRSAISKRLGLNIEELDFTTNKYGKPFLINEPNIHFNISHSGRLISCAIDDKPVGIDIEVVKTTDFKIAYRFFTNDEKEFIFTKKEELRERCFYEIWTKKESFIKWKGEGLSIPLKSFSVLELTYENGPFYFQVYNNNNAICHVCTEKNELYTLNKFVLNDIFNELLDKRR